LLRRYQEALQAHLKQGARARLKAAQRLGREAISIGLETFELAKIHGQALAALGLATYAQRDRTAMFRRAGAFFAEALIPIEQTHRTAREVNIRLNTTIGHLRRRRADLAKANQELKREVGRRKSVEKALRTSERHQCELLESSRLLQEQLRHLSRELLSAQEEERKRISRELHDQIAQILTGINFRLATLKTEAAVNTKGLRDRIASAQRLVVKSVDIVHRFARDLRPTVLDDLGLVPALHSFVKEFSKRTRIHVSVTVCAAVEKLDGVSRTVLYRVAQEALTNVARHAGASRVDLSVQKIGRTISLKVADNGKSFQVERAFRAKKNRRLGLLGMRERIEMVGGQFEVESAPGQGTTVHARIPASNGKRAK
jgi:signal transduction histidine kinase